MSVSEVRRTWIERTARTALLLLCLRPALGQPAHTVTAADIDRAKRSQPVVSEQDIERAQKRNRMPTEAELRAAPVPSTPNVDRLPQPHTPRSPSVEAIARGFEASGRAGDGAIEPMRSPTSDHTLLVFVSFSMPWPTLQRLVEQAALAKAALIVRGFVNGSLKDTVVQVQRLIGQRDVAFLIDPQAFDRFAIDKTPSFVLLRDGALSTPCAVGQCFATDAFAVTAGDVSLDYALGHIQRTAPKVAREAAQYLKRLRR